MILFDAASQPYSIGGLDNLVCPEMEWANILALTPGTGGPDVLTRGTLSIKCAFGGREVYRVGDRRHVVSDDRLLVLNCGEQYASAPETQSVESFCLFFHPRFVDEALRTRISPDDYLLEHPGEESGGSLHFLDDLYSESTRLHRRLRGLRDRLRSRNGEVPAPDYVAEQFHLVLGDLLESHREVMGRMMRLDQVRYATRVELYRRLERARSFIADNFRNRFVLDDIAGAAALSPHYLLRLFRTMYGNTPHQYLTELRIRHARGLLEKTSDSVTTVCFDSGFESPASFSLLFRKHTGFSPRAYRRNARQR